MKPLVFILFFVSIHISAFSQNNKISSERTQHVYDSAYNILAGMLKGSSRLSFKEAVFVTENAYFDNALDYQLFDRNIRQLVQLCRNEMDRGGLQYTASDRSEVLKYWSVFMVMKVLKVVQVDTTKNNYHTITPFAYDFNDFWGERDWAQMFVTKLLKTRSGNCHSLPFLYKILCEELGAKAYLAMAPNHIYIKLWSRQNGWYNTELTSGQFPIDAWIMASGYVHLSAIQNGIYMDTLSSRQSIAVCVIDLAKGYEQKLGKSANLNFINRCVDLALKYYPQYVNALILKAETQKKHFEAQMIAHKAVYPSDIFNIPEEKLAFDNMEKLYFHIYKIGYRAMPAEMYENWLAELNAEKDKYTNKDISRDFNPTTK